MFDVTTSRTPVGFRARVGRLAQNLVPNADQWAYARDRAADRRARSKDAGYHGLVSAAQELGPVGEREPHVVVVPTEGPSHGTWVPGVRNLYFEAAQTLTEVAGPERVTSFFAEPGETPMQWQRRLVDHLGDTKATHLLTHIEGDPGNLNSWTWDSFWEIVSPRWDGVFLGCMFDSSYRFTAAKAKIMAKMSNRFVLVDICMPMDGALIRNRRESGPVNMPMSLASQRLLNERLAGVTPAYDLSFFGVLYDYRVKLIEELQSEGITVAVNPHRKDGAEDGRSTRMNQPAWLDYMAGIAASKMTVNFSQSNAGPFEQLKTRVMEVGLAGTYLLTDDRDRTRRFWDEGSFSAFEEPADLLMTSQRLLADPDDLARATTAFHDRANFLARNHYWGAIEATLRARNLPSLGIDAFSD